MTTHSYTVFEFKSGQVKNSLHLACSVVVCQASEESGICKTEPLCGNRGSRARRDVHDSGMVHYQVKKSFEFV